MCVTFVRLRLCPCQRSLGWLRVRRIAWNAVRVTCASLDSVALVFEGASVEWRNLAGGIVALHRAIRPP